MCIIHRLPPFGKRDKQKASIHPSEKRSSFFSTGFMELENTYFAREMRREICQKLTFYGRYEMREQDFLFLPSQFQATDCRFASRFSWMVWETQRRILDLPRRWHLSGEERVGSYQRGDNMSWGATWTSFPQVMSRLGWVQELLSASCTMELFLLTYVLRQLRWSRKDQAEFNLLENIFSYWPLT